MLRQVGVLLHPSSFPGKYGMGDFGKAAYEFINFLSRAKISLWQILPLNPVSEVNSPYQSDSAFAGNIWMICIEQLEEKGFLDKSDIKQVDSISNKDFAYTKRIKGEYFRKAFERFHACSTEKMIYQKERFDYFCAENAFWLDDYSLYITLKEQYGRKPWWKWNFTYNDKEELIKKGLVDSTQVLYHKFLQFLFYQQWNELKSYANEHGIRVIGDIPIYVAPDSADVWAHKELFQFNDNEMFENVSGAPPDEFSVTGQKWNGCLYKWEQHEKDKYQWWISRVQFLLKCADVVRFDHFNGLFRYWSIPKDGEPNEGHYEQGPGESFVKSLTNTIGQEKIIVEDLGNVTEEAVRVRDSYHLMGMQVLQNGDCDFSRQYCVLYSGTHDNNTLRGWLEHNNGIYKDVWECIEKLILSKSKYVIFQLQDILEVGEEGRMNIPGLEEGNWEYQYKSEDLTDELCHKLRKCVEYPRR